ncbi:OTU domain-containing protein 6B [Clohesyomyces aquaticus]|uniref:OTU domain-containing protein 6B n=1 Tax=Clohesyomyces aquaticus TaxID=1231657 RepID=A0A1Y1ZED4_9PLEO|nr:OTU domain-containing protein 6B [Clohesyomyces aquaticus]
MSAPETLEALQSRHRKEQRDLVARTTQKKKAATKKTRKGVGEECERLEQEQKARQAQELAALSGEATGADDAPAEESASEDEKAAHDDEDSKATEKLASLSLQPNGSTPAAPESESPDGSANAPQKRPNRAKARLARRAAEQEALAAKAAEEASNLPDLREQERTRMKAHFSKYGLQEKEIRADGHCLYAAIADQMETAGLGLKPKIQPRIVGEETAEKYRMVRYAAADFIEENPDDFVAFMEEPLDAYLRKIRETGEWGGHMELLALAKTYGVDINVLHGDGRVDKITAGEHTSAKSGEARKEIWLGYYRHDFGLGEHYNSLRKTP